ncbi:hypothetical protein PTKIN_Ptkin04bG0201700 [Pterospermum kingtungense]
MNQVKGLLLDMVVAGTDTISTMVEWTMAELIQHPEIMEKVKKELADVVGLYNTVEEVHLPNLRYLHAVTKETFQLHSPLPLLAPRCSGQSSIVGGYTIPKDSRVFLNVWYMPFGSGRRKCPGVSLGEKMLYFMLASFLHSFEWELPQGTKHDLSSKFGWVMKKKKPLLLIPKPRLLNLELYTK